MEGAIYIDGDFPVRDSECKHYCSPTCHPAQIGPTWVYGCTHEAWPQNRHRDFCPIVECEGKISKCGIPKKFIQRMINGRKQRIKNAYGKARKCLKDIKELKKLLHD